MIRFFAPSPDLFVSGGNLFNKQIVKALRELKCKVRYADYADGWFESFRGEQLLFDSIYVHQMDGGLLQNAPNTKYLLLHLMPSMIGEGQGIEFEKNLLQVFDSIIVNSVYSLDYCLQNYGIKKTILIHPFIDIPEEFERNPEAGKVILVANWLPSKQIYEFLETLATQPIPKGMKFHLFGDNSLNKNYFDKCISFIRQSPLLRKHIVLEKPLPHDELWYEYDTADLFIDTSKFETFGLAVAEAVAAGVPVLSLGNGNVKNLVSEKSICRDMETLTQRIVSGAWGKADIQDRTGEIITNWESFKKQCIPLV